MLGEQLLEKLRQADKLLPSLLDEISESGKFGAPLTYRGRVKGKAETDDKIKRKQIEDPNYGLDSVTDIIGIRFVTIYRGEISKVVCDLLDLIGSNPFGNKLESSKLLELTQYVSNIDKNIDIDAYKENDPTHVAIKKHFEGVDEKFDGVEFSAAEKGQYSSIHIVLSVKTNRNGENCIPVELQIRSVFEEAWGEIDHQLFYEQARISSVEAAKSRNNLSNELGLLKSMLDNAASFAELLFERRNIENRELNEKSEAIAEAALAAAADSDENREQQRIDKPIDHSNEIHGSDSFKSIFNYKVRPIEHASPSEIVSFLQERYVRVSEFGVGLEEYYALDKLAIFIGRNYKHLEEILKSIKRAWSNNNNSLIISLPKADNDRKSCIVSFCGQLKNVAYVTESRYNRNNNTQFLAISNDPVAKKFITDDWIERYAVEEIKRIVADLEIEDIECKTTIKANAADGAGFAMELDVICRVGNQYFWIEAKSGNNLAQHVERCSILNKDYLMFDAENMILLLSLAQDNDLAALSLNRGITVCNLNNFARLLKEKFTKAIDL